MQRTIFSVYFQKMKALRKYRSVSQRNGGYLTEFVLEPAPRDGYTLLVVDDMAESFQFQSDAPVSDLPKYADGPYGIAADLLQEWSGGVAGEEFGGPGMGICMDEDEKDASGNIIRPATNPSERELATARRRQTTWATWNEMKANDAWVNGKRGEVIGNPLYKGCAEWLGHGGHEWLRAPEMADAMTQCPVCNTKISGAPMLCPNCQKVIDPERYYRREMEMEQIQAKFATMRAEALKNNPSLAGTEAFEAVSVGGTSMPPPAKLSVPQKPQQQAR